MGRTPSLWLVALLVLGVLGVLGLWLSTGICAGEALPSSLSDTSSRLGQVGPARGTGSGGCESSVLERTGLVVGRFPRKYCFMAPRVQVAASDCCRPGNAGNVSCFNEFWTYARCCVPDEEERAVSCARALQDRLAACMASDGSLGGCRSQGDGAVCRCPAVMFDDRAKHHKVNELSNDFNRALWCVARGLLDSSSRERLVVDFFMAKGHSSHVLAHGLTASVARRWRLGGFEMDAGLSQAAAESLGRFGGASVVKSCERWPQSGVVVVNGKAPTRHTEADCLRRLCGNGADLVVLDPDFQILMQEEFFLLEDLCRPAMYAVNNINLAAHGGWIKEYLVTVGWLELAAGSSPDFNSFLNAAQGKGNALALSLRSWSLLLRPEHACRL
ncbi:unnamed protein product [Effrenium voratum]|uniref:Uncharacterized protein n=1 Tax=Effrenium voratum TaxID=2562239 RepID=A0AA36JBV1_9DINO|nr:unnamed protein product [Effrenium voratum]